jgi:hypothetical protein
MLARFDEMRTKGLIGVLAVDPAKEIRLMTNVRFPPKEEN